MTPRAHFFPIPALVLFGALYLGYHWHRAQGTPIGSISFPSLFPAPQPVESLPFEMSAYAFSRQYDGNEVGADLAYRERRITVRGHVSGTTWLKYGVPCVVLDGWNGASSIACAFPAERVQEIADAGGMVAIRGICRGKIAGVVLLVECRFAGGREATTLPSPNSPAIIPRDAVNLRR